MKANYLRILSLPLIFFLGFLAGSYWQAMIARPVVTHSQQTVEAATGIVDTAKRSDDEKLSQAMEDPDFKRVHDFLVRENPMQMNLETPKPSETDKSVPFSERPPVNFSVPN